MLLLDLFSFTDFKNNSKNYNVNVYKQSRMVHFLLGMGDVQSETTKQMFDSKANLLLKEQYARATNLLQKNKGMLDKLADALMQEHSLNARRINEVLQAVEGTQEECMNVGE